MKDSSKKSALIQLLGLALIFVILSAYVLGSFYIKSRSNVCNFIEEKYIAAADGYGKNLGNRLTVLAAVAAPVSGLLGEGGLRNRKECVRLLGALAENTDAYLTVFAGTTGQGVDNSGRNIHLSDKEYFAVSEETAYYYTKDDGILGKEALIAAVPCMSGGKPAGMLYAYLELTELEKLLERSSLGETYFYLLADSRGNIIAQGGYPEGFAAEGNLARGLEQAEFKEGESLDSALNKVKAYKEGFITAKMEGIEYELFFSSVQINDWRFFVGVRETYLTAGRNDLLRPVRGVIIGILLTVGLFSVLLLVTNFLNKYFYNEHKKELEEKASKDLLTDLSNKASTEYLIKEYIETHPDSLGLMFVLDVDNFKKINDTLGHAFGDEVLRELGKRLRGEFRISDIVGRTGGDEFIIFMKDMNDESIMIREAQRLRRFFGTFQVGEYVKYSPSASVGASVYPRDGKTFEELYKAADSALYSVKRKGKNNVAFYGDKENVKVEESSCETAQEGSKTAQDGDYGQSV